MQLIDGKQQMLSRPEIVMRSIPDTPDKEKIVKQVAIQHASPKTFLVQRYNTVFMYKTNKKGDKAYGVMYNIDTPKNAVENIMHLLTVLQRRKVDTYVTTFGDPTLLELYLTVNKRIISKGYDSTMQVKANEKEGKTRYMLAVKLGKDRLHKGS